MQQFTDIISAIADFLWGWPLLIMLLGTHLFLTFRLAFIQRHIHKGIKMSVKPEKKSTGDISPFSALATSLAATIGTGNIVGVATAVSMGGPGAIFWMWITGIFGIATKYTESLLSVYYRVKNADGTYSGGPMYVIERGLRCKWLAVLFAIFTVLASFGIGSSIQANSLTAALNYGFGMSPLYCSIIVTIGVGAVIIGGIKSISSVCKALVPFMGFFYIIGCIALLVLGHENLASSIGLIIDSAFNPSAAGGAFAGMSIIMTARYGVARGLFSNESGLGSAPIVAASAQTSTPVKQAMISATGTFWDTVVVCALTGLVIVNTGVWNNGGEGMSMTKEAFSQIPVVGGYFLCVALVTFTFSTILGWYLYAEKCVQYLFGNRGITPYRIIYLITVFLGGILSLKLVWALGDIFNGLMALPNLVSLILLSGLAAWLTKKHKSNFCS
ncbi:MAG: alanine:cation symporter family protein [Paludibacteraceae bacterium]|nr:alanine:cation symporter family protein [Paludibacteraceae bacterium]